MNLKKVISELKEEYPGGKIIENKNDDGVTTEVICELDSDDRKSIAIAVIDSSVIHYHRIITETYRVLKGSLTVFKYDQEEKLYKEHEIGGGESIEIKPGEIHSNLGDETWIEVISEPPWRPGDFYNLDTIIKKYVRQEED
jgi:mannose-6-phosphate isomerase-like protein (cupin superfamily)